MTTAAAAKGRFAAPASVEAYRTLGPFDSTSVPAGLLKEHRLKPGTWARLSVLSGAIGFVWDDTANEEYAIVLEAGASMDVPPTVPHHLELGEEDFSIRIEFLADPR